MFSFKDTDKKLVEQPINFTHEPNLTENIPMEILSRKFEPIALEIDQFENRHTNNTTWTFSNVFIPI